MDCAAAAICFPPPATCSNRQCDGKALTKPSPCQGLLHPQNGIGMAFPVFSVRSLPALRGFQKKL